MTRHQFLVDLRAVLFWFGSLNGVAAGILGAWASSQRNPDKSRTQLWFKSKWSSLRTHSFHALPEATVRWLGTLKHILIGRTYRAYERFGFWLLRLMPLILAAFLWITAERHSHVHPVGLKAAAIWTLLILTSIVAYFVVVVTLPNNSERWTNRVFGFLLLVLLPSVFILVHSLSRLFQRSVLALVVGYALFTIRGPFVQRLKELERKSVPIGRGQNVWSDVLTLGMVSMGVYTIASGLEVAVRSPIGWGLAILLVLIPFIAWVASHWSGDFLADKTGSRRNVRFVFFGWSIGASLCITALMLLVGHEFAPSVSVPQTMRLLLCNTICDAVTVVVSLQILEAAISHQGRLRLVRAVLLCIVLGALFAGASVWIGVGSLTMLETARIFMARSMDGRHWELGPYFWVMHSTFLPLLSFVALLLLGWSGKLMIKGLEKFFGRAQHEDVNGLNMTSRYLGVVSILSGLTVAVISLFL